ncbi:MAG TPA: hypothetical protein DCM73_07285 [Clostridiales bacterium]|nr:hypothetical protein [Clostridiales bacterium]
MKIIISALLITPIPEIIYSVHNMVHNEYVVGYLEEKGIKVIYDNEAVPENTILIFCA